MPSGAQRFFVRSADSQMVVGFDDLNAATAVALDYDEGENPIDANSQAYLCLLKT